MPREEPDTLLAVLASRARKKAGRPVFHFLETSFSYQELWEGIERFGSFLAAQKLERGDRVILALPNGPEFLIGLYGTQLAGGVAVPLFPESGPDRIFSIASLCGAGGVVVSSDMPREMARNFKQLSSRTSKNVITVEESKAHPPLRPLPKVRPEDMAFIQYTSGSTGNPKGVCITQSGILLNIGQMVEGMEITKEDVFVSWLPVHHDMGLILMTMVPLYLGATGHLLPSSLMNIRLWIKTIARARGTFTAAPDFAYRWVLLYIREPGDYDLSSLRVAVNAAEPVRAKTVGDFQRAFRLGNVMMPAYGLAEATVGVSCWPPGKPVKVDHHGFVSVGQAFPRIGIEILQEEKPAGPGAIGEIAVRSPANTPGYFGNPAETRRLFWKGRYIRTGDLGYRDEEGDLFVVGREKNIIIQSGQNISPQEIEETVDELPFVRLSAAIGVDRGHVDGEQVYVFAEIRARAPASVEDLQEKSAEIIQRYLSRMGFRPGRVYLLKPRSIPRTPNGKVRYPILKTHYLNGRLRREGRILFPDY